jgi:hypothetical protein
VGKRSEVHTSGKIISTLGASMNVKACRDPSAPPRRFWTTSF